MPAICIIIAAFVIGGFILITAISHGNTDVNDKSENEDFKEIK